MRAARNTFQPREVDEGVLPDRAGAGGGLRGMPRRVSLLEHPASPKFFTPAGKEESSFVQHRPLCSDRAKPAIGVKNLHPIQSYAIPGAFLTGRPRHRGRPVRNAGRTASVRLQKQHHGMHEVRIARTGVDFISVSDTTSPTGLGRRSRRLPGSRAAPRGLPA